MLRDNPSIHAKQIKIDTGGEGNRTCVLVIRPQLSYCFGTCANLLNRLKFVRITFPGIADNDLSSDTWTGIIPSSQLTLFRLKFEA